MSRKLPQPISSSLSINGTSPDRAILAFARHGADPALLLLDYSTKRIVLVDQVSIRVATYQLTI
jgi:hypothetical protein